MIAKLLYTISNYEKARCSIKEMKSKQYIRALKEAIYVMDIVIRSLKNKIIDEASFEIIARYIDKHTVLSTMQEKLLYIYYAEELCFYDFDNDRFKLLCLMEGVLAECNSLLTKKLLQNRKSNSMKIIYLLMALHNLPRAFLEDNDRMALPPDEAYKYAKSYILKSGCLSLLPAEEL